MAGLLYQLSRSTSRLSLEIAHAHLFHLQPNFSGFLTGWSRDSQWTSRLSPQTPTTEVSFQSLKRSSVSTVSCQARSDSINTSTSTNEVHGCWICLVELVNWPLVYPFWLVHLFRYSIVHVVHLLYGSRYIFICDVANELTFIESCLAAREWSVQAGGTSSLAATTWGFGRGLMLLGVHASKVTSKLVACEGSCNDFAFFCCDVTRFCKALAGLAIVGASRASGSWGHCGVISRFTVSPTSMGFQSSFLQQAVVLRV